MLCQKAILILRIERSIMKRSPLQLAIVPNNYLIKNNIILKVEQVNVVEFLRSRCHLEQFSEELIHRVCGLLEVNAFAGHTQYGNEVSQSVK